MTSAGADRGVSVDVSTWWENPLMSTLFRASSHMSHELSFHTWAAMLYSSINGSWTTTHTLGQTYYTPHSRNNSYRAMRGKKKNHIWWYDVTFNLCEVELQRVISGQRHHEASGQVLRQWISMVTEEETVVAERWHGDADLSQVIQILQYRSLGGKYTNTERTDKPHCKQSRV